MLRIITVLALAFGLTLKASAFTYVTAKTDPEVVVHPFGYTGQGGELTITLGLDPEFAEFEDEVAFSAEHVAAIWNSLLVWEENLGPSIEIPRIGGTDFLGTLIHEFGHALGIAHPTLMGTEVDARRGRGKFSMATEGPNGKFDIDEGGDGLRGSADDRRGDDINTVYFKKDDNNPFVLPENDIIDSTTYSRDLADLPSEDSSPNVASREVASDVFSLPQTEAMLVGGGSLVPGMIRRGLGANDVAAIRYAMSGIDEIQGTSDDYTLRIEWVGLSDNADVMIRFDKTDGNASVGVGVRPVSGKHKVMGKNRVISYNQNLAGNRQWYFPQPEPVPSESRILNERALEWVIDSKRGVRYGLSWPSSALAEEDKASDIIVQCNDERSGAVSGRLFLFVAEAESTTIKIAFPTAAPSLKDVSVFRLTARTAN